MGGAYDGADYGSAHGERRAAGPDRDDHERRRAGRHRGREPGDRRGHRSRPGPRPRRDRRHGASRPRRPARVGGARLRRPRPGAAPRAALAPRQRRPRHRDDRLRDRQAWEDAQAAELAYGASAFGFWAKHAPKYLADERVRSASVFVAGKRLVLRYRPLGLVGVIGPWNYPLTNSFGDAIPALAAGNSVILKPSEITPLTSLLLADGLRQCGLPDDVLQIATGRGPTGEALVDAVDMVMFTGSTTTGRKVMARAAQTLTPVALELGGKDPMIVLSDADLERAAN